ncbi:hypothetical protein [Leucothrix pacifica]|uniref:Uncharacterized protein n=1 Tax=Leucothrix pacifica TaxID=1247513 RepID=A0A317C2S3_9GAMM|nr:hypothetical protein [Leucothrix pacifica]PWQ92629.1 hypothetical protein DKW60_20040 [Leucothrix pacifica]
MASSGNELLDRQIRTASVAIGFSLLLIPQLAFSLADDNRAEGDCAIIVTGKVAGNVTANCPGIPQEAIDKLIGSIEETIGNQNDHIQLLKEKIAKLEADQKKALAENTEDLKLNPEDALLIAERDALKRFDMEFAAQLREKYFRKKLTEKRAEQKARLQALEAQLAEENRALSHEAFIAGERWESANNLSKALPLYQEAVEIDEGNRQAWRQVTFVAKKLGKTQLALEAARSLQKQLNPESDTKWLLSALNDEGDLLRSQGENRIALDRYQQSMKLTQKLVETEPENTEWQRDLSVSHNKVGDMHKANGDGVSALKAYEDGLAIAKALAELDPKHTQWQRDLSVSHNKVGDMHKANGDGVSALKAYEDGLAIAKTLAELDPKHTEWQRDLSVSFERVGDMHKANGDGLKALKAYEESLAIRKTLAELDPKHTGWKRDLLVLFKVKTTVFRRSDLSAILFLSAKFTAERLRWSIGMAATQFSKYSIILFL